MAEKPATGTARLKQRILDLEDEVAYYKSLVEAFYSGDVPPGASLQHVVLAQYGRLRHEKIRPTAALLKEPGKA
jgi:hypothetical protein